MANKLDSRANVNVRMDGSKLIIEIETDLDKVNAQLSSSGKTLTVATTGGYMWNHPLPGYGLNLTFSRRNR